MPSGAPVVELDFIGLRHAAAAGDDHPGGATTFSSIRGMRTSAIASIGAQQLRRVIAGEETLPEPEPEPAPMTLFYNGAVVTFDVPHVKAEAILKMAMEVTTSNAGRGHGNAFAGNFAKDMPLRRTKSLQQFLQKRKDRLTRLGPYQLGLGGTGGVGGAASKSFHVKEEASYSSLGGMAAY